MRPPIRSGIWRERCVQLAIPYAEPCQYPEGLLENPDVFVEDHLSAENRRWWVLYTKARQEKAVARELFAGKVPFYLPQVKRTGLYRGRKLSSFVPLFTGYVFLLGSERERIRALATNRLSCVLPVPDTDGLWRDLRQIQHLIESDAPLTPERRLVPGTRVRVKSGALAGLEGTVFTRRGRTRLLVHVDFLGQGASAEIDDFLLEQIA